MARDYGRGVKDYDSRLQRCYITGRLYYESELVRRGGHWIHPDYLDETGLPKTKSISVPTLQEIAARQSYFELDSDGNITTRDSSYSMNDDSRGICFYELNSGGQLQAKSSLPASAMYMEQDSLGRIMLKA